MPKPLTYPPKTYYAWRKFVLQRDNYVCQECQKQKCRIAHHIKSYINHPELRLDIKNGMTLCKKCHKKFKKERNGQKTTD